MFKPIPTGIDYKVKQINFIITAISGILWNMDENKLNDLCEECQEIHELQQKHFLAMSQSLFEFGLEELKKCGVTSDILKRSESNGD